MTFLAGVRMDRLEEVRTRGGEVFPADTRVVGVRAGHVPLRREGGLGWVALGELQVPPERLVLLGEHGGVRWAALGLEGEEEAGGFAARAGAEFEGLRAAALLAPGDEAGILAYAGAMVAWHETARYCGRCGAATVPSHAGHQRVCTGPDCGGPLFPRTDVAVITLVTAGERALLIHQPGWRERQFATVAGFLEPGEGLEEAVRREILEEVGLRALEVRYRASQPWPFPHSVMVGFRTEVEYAEPVPNEEVLAARWFTRAELAAAAASGEIVLSQRLSISRLLVDQWLAEG